MFRRMTMVLFASLLAAAPALAQPNDEFLPNAPRPLDEGPLSASQALPTGWSFPPAEKRIWLSADYLATFFRGTLLPPLVTTSDPGTAKLSAGVLDVGSTRALFGSDWANDNYRNGVRMEGGWWFNPEQTLGIEAGAIVVESQVSAFSAVSGGTPILARPFTNTVSGAPSSLLIAFPGVATGSIDARAESANFYEVHVDVTEKAIDDGWFRLYSLLGYRYYRYDERLTVRQIVNPIEPPFVPGTQIITNDNIHARNEFHGIDLGFRSQFVWERVTLDVLTKVAVGRVFRVVNIGGDQLTTVPGAVPLAQAGGFLASSTNGGIAGSSDTKVMPEVTAVLNWQVRPRVNLRLGYTFILLNDIARAADKVDTTINPNFLPGGNPALGGPLRPAQNNTRSDMWIQAINFGVLFTY